MRHHVRQAVIAFGWGLVFASCTTNEKPTPAYSYSATIWQNPSANQPLLTASGTTNQTGGYLGHFLGERVSIAVAPTPEDSVIVGTLSIASPTLEKSLPIKTWSKDGKTMYAICASGYSDKPPAVVSIETDSKTLTDPLLRELIGKFVPDKPDAGGGN
jgi:hypothetical protein